MKLVDGIQIWRNAIAQTMGENYMPLMDTTDPDHPVPIDNKAFASLDSQALIDIGKDVTSENTISSLNNNLVALIGKHIIETRTYTTRVPSIYVESFDWGGFLERTRLGLGEIFDDPMYTKKFGDNFAEFEHTYFGQPTYSKIFEEAKAIVCPISIEREQLRDAFNGWDKMNEYIGAKEAKIRSTINLALGAMEKMLLQTAVAVSDVKNNSAVHLITEAVALDIVDPIPLGTDPETYRNPTYDEVRLNPEFIAYVMFRIKQIRSYMFEISTAFNDKTMPTWCDEDPTLVLLDDFVDASKVYVKANTFNPEEIGVGAVDTIPSWQAVYRIDTTPTPDVEYIFDPITLSSVDVAANADGKIGQTTEYKKSGVIGLMFDKSAIGICLHRAKVTSNYTACADFWNTYYHELVNHIIDSSYGIVAFIAD